MTQPNEQLIETIEKALEKRKKFMEPGLDELWLRALLEENKRLSERNDLQREVNLIMEKRYEQVKAERDRLRSALEDVADYQHRWSDSPITEVQKIARSILSQYKTEDTQ